MSKVYETDVVDKLVYQVLHDLADKYDLDVDLLGDIVADYCGVLSDHLEGKIIVSRN